MKSSVLARVENVLETPLERAWPVARVVSLGTLLESGGGVPETPQEREGQLRGCLWKHCGRAPAL